MTLDAILIVRICPAQEVCSESCRWKFGQQIGLSHRDFPRDHRVNFVNRIFYVSFGLAIFGV